MGTRTLLQPFHLDAVGLVNVREKVVLARKLFPTIRADALEPRVLVVPDAVGLAQVGQEPLLALEHVRAVVAGKGLWRGLGVLVAEVEVVVVRLDFLAALLADARLDLGRVLVQLVRPQAAQGVDLVAADVTRVGLVRAVDLGEGEVNGSRTIPKSGFRYDCCENM